ncbi:MAG: tetratricopeptide repeat protein [Anaerovoracaceae bacterium]
MKKIEKKIEKKADNKKEGKESPLQATAISSEKYDIRKREDRIGKYLKKYLNKFVFVEFKPEFLKGTKIENFMKGVPVPLRKKDIKEFAGGNGLKPNHIAENMAWVIGCDPNFKYADNYIQYMNTLFNYKIWEGMVKVGRDAAEDEDFDNACVHFRAALCMQPDYIHGMYSYARVCRSMYEVSHNQEYIGRFKAEALEFFEMITEIHPRFAQAYYYLGYSYLNMGLYNKAALVWEVFIKKSTNNKDRKEIKQRLEQIKDPKRIEEGCNLVLRGEYDAALDILEPYTNSKFDDWWPLYYYSGVSYYRLGQVPKAVSAFKKCLVINPIHLETMEELLSIYQSQKDKENVEKYRKKIDMVKKDIEKEMKNRR